MTRNNSLFALIGCSFAFASSLCVADDSPAVAAEKSETSAATTVAPTTAPAIVTWPLTLAPVKKVKEKGLPNFGKLNEFIWRSGQPSKEGYARLKELGVKTIVNLRKEAPADKEKLPEGINYINIPIVDERAPTAEQAQQFIDIASDSKNWPILVHCHGGEGRAGVMSALVRFAFDGWDNDKIMKETGTFRVAHLGFIKTRMCGSQREFLQEWATAHKAGEYSAKFAKPAEVASIK
jgi:tyrosine-protein phosphatase SIW14